MLDALTLAQKLSSWLLHDAEPMNLEILSASLASALPEAPPALEAQFPEYLSRLGYCYLQELANSISVQQRLLPERPPTLEGVEIAVRYLPRLGVSGDYYDFLPLQEGKLGIALGDVCGNGMGAALLMASLHANLQVQVQAEPMMIAGELLNRINRIFHRDTLSHQFATLIYGIWDTNNHTFTYSSAGHPPILHHQFATGKVRELNVGGIILGICEDTEYASEAVSLDVGDVLMLYTDGITEATNSLDEEFGVHRLKEVTGNQGKESCATLLEAILDSVSQFTHENWQDDITLVAIKRIATHCG